MGKSIKADLSCLPRRKEEELRHITRIIHDTCKTEFIILFGSYARGDYVERDVTYAKGLGYPEEFRSDFDILIILDSGKSVNRHYMKLHRLQSNLDRKLAKKEILTPVSLLFYGIDEINDLLEKESNPFFKDVTEQGITLYDSKKYKLSRAQKIDAKQKKELAQRYFDHWLEKAESSLKGFHFYLHEKENNDAAFNLHQATERLLNAILLVHSFYSPKSHDIEKLLELTERFDKSIQKTFPRKRTKEKRLFELLKASYVDARYSPAFRITEDELKQIAKYVGKLMKITERLCKKKIKKYD